MRRIAFDDTHGPMTKTPWLWLAASFLAGCGGNQPEAAPPPSEPAPALNPCTQKCLDDHKPPPAQLHATKCICFGICDQLPAAKAEGCSK